MKNFYLFLSSVVSLFFHSAQAQEAHTPAYARFTQNKGQWPAQVHYMARLSGGALWVDNGGLTFDFYHPEDLHRIEEMHHGHAVAGSSDALRSHVYKMKFVMNPAAVFSAQGQEKDYANYYLGNDPALWVSHASISREVKIANAIKGADYHVYTKDGYLKYDIIVHPGTKVSDLGIEYEGVEALYLKNGDLHIRLSHGEVIEKAPVAYQTDRNGQRVEVSTRFVVQGNRLGFVTGSYDPTRDLVIDPTLIFSTYTGSTADNWGFTATYDNAGNLYSGGIAFSSGYPTTAGAYLTTYSGSSVHAAISKFNPTGTGLLYSTYLGGTQADAPHSLVVDANDNLIVMGTTSSSNFPVTAGAYQTTYGGGTSTTVNGVTYASGSDIFVTRFNSTGTALLNSTFVGGSGLDGINTDATLSFNYADESRGEVVVDAAGNVYVCSATRSSNFPATAGALSSTLSGTQDGCAFKLNASFSTLLWSTYLGGTNADAAYSVKLGTNGRVYVTGGTRSTNFPVTAGALITTAPGGSVDGFVIALNDASGASVVSTYLGTNNYDQAYLLELNVQNEVFVVGQTKGAYPVSAGVYSNANGRQFIHKLSPDLNATEFSTVFGSGASAINISPTALLVDNCQNIYISGWGGAVNAEGSTSGLPVTADAYDAVTDGSDFYFIVLEKEAQSLLYGSFFGAGTLAEHVDGGTSRFDKNGTIYQAVCAGCGGSDAFPTTPGVWSSTNNSSNCNLGAIKMQFVYTGVEANADASPNIIACDPPYDVTFTGASGAVHHIWDFDDGTSSNLLNPTHTFSDTGYFNIMYIAIDSSTCNIADTAYLSVQILQAEEFAATIDIPPYDPCTGGPLVVNLAFTGSGADYIQWTMGDGTVYTNQDSITHTYTTSGTYVMQMYAYDSTCALSGTITDTIYYNSNVLNVSASASPNIFACDPPYTVTFSNGGTVAPMHYWDFDNGDTSLLANPTYTFTDTGSYTITYIAIDSATCNIADTSYLSVEILQSEVFDAVIDVPPYDPCTGGPLVINLEFTGSGADYLEWTMGDGTTYTNTSSVTHTYTTQGVYIVEMYAYDSVCGRSGTVTDTIYFQPEFVEVEAEASPNVFACDPPITVNFSNGGGIADTHIWVFGDGTPNGNTPSPAHTFTQSGIYNVMYVAIDSSSCNFADTSYVTVTLEEAEDFSADFNFTPPPPCQDTLLVNIAFTGSGADSLVWSMGNGDFFVNDSVISYFYITPGVYTLMLTAYDYDCGKVESISSVIVKEEAVFDEPVLAPNVFTPNGDGINDYFFIGYSGFPFEITIDNMEEFGFTVFDRWGVKAYENNGVAEGWDGKINGKEASNGVYFYIARYKLKCGQDEPKTITGHVTLSR